MSAPESQSRPVGFVVNPMSGRDVRRMAARASRVTPESKRDRIARAVVGAVASGAERVIVVRDPSRIATGAVENLRLDAEIEVLDLNARMEPADTRRAVEAMRKADCGALVVLGGDGTNRTVCQAWLDAPVVPLSTGTNNAFPLMVEATAGRYVADFGALGRVAFEVR